MLYIYSDPDLSADKATQDRNWSRPMGKHGRCLLCYAPVNNERTVRWFHLHEGGVAIVTEVEADKLNAEGRESWDCGAYPIGPECYRKHKAVLAPYVSGGQ